MQRELADEVALVTGAGRGIGRAVAVRLADAGCAVALLARTAAAVHTVADEITARGGRAVAVPADVTDDRQLEAAVEHARAAWGRISILVNAAGTAPPRTTHAKAAIAQWDPTLATCLRAPLVLTRLVLPAMLAAGAGAVINIASVAAHRPRAGEAVYAAAKAGLVAFGQALFAEVHDHGIKVSTISPGYVDTAFVPPNRRVDRGKFLRPEDIAMLVLQILRSAPRICPTSLIVEPQFDPERHDGQGAAVR